MPIIIVRSNRCPHWALERSADPLTHFHQRCSQKPLPTPLRVLGGRKTGHPVPFVSLFFRRGRSSLTLSLLMLELCGKPKAHPTKKKKKKKEHRLDIM